MLLGNAVVCVRGVEKLSVSSLKKVPDEEKMNNQESSSVPSNCSLKQPLYHYRVKGESEWRDVSNAGQDSMNHEN